MRLLSSLLCIPVMAQVSPTPAADQVIAQARKELDARAKAYRAHLEAGRPRSDFRWDVSKSLGVVEARLKRESDPKVLEALKVARLAYRLAGHLEVSPAEFQEARQAIPVESRAWSIQPSLVLRLAASPDDKAGLAYIAEVRAHNPVLAVRAHLLKVQLEDALETKDTQAWQSALGALQRDHAGSQELVDAQRAVRLHKLTLVGLQAPPFEVASFDEPGKVLNNKRFAGQYLILDFWATWCPDCRVELPGLRRAWQQFKTRNLAILSLSFDQKPGDLRGFLAKPGEALPWHHAFLQGAWKHPLASTFGVVGIPKILLIGPDGRILATDGELRGHQLEQTLDRILPKVEAH